MGPGMNNDLDHIEVQRNVIGSAKGSKQGEKNSSGIYKPYNIKDFKNMQHQASVKLGGLGANIGGENWEQA